MTPVLFYVSLAVCAILAYFVILYRRELAGRPQYTAPEREPSPKGADPKRVEEFSKQLRGLAAVAMELGEDLTWAPKTVRDVALASNTGEAILAAALQLVASNKRLLGELAAARSRSYEGGAESGQRAVHEELGRRLAELRRGKMPFSLLCLGIDDSAKLQQRYGPPVAQAVLRKWPRSRSRPCAAWISSRPTPRDGSPWSCPESA